MPANSLTNRQTNILITILRTPPGGEGIVNITPIPKDAVNIGRPTANQISAPSSLYTKHILYFSNKTANIQ